MPWVIVAACAASACLHLLLVVPRMPAPAVEPGDPVPDYGAVARPVDALGVTILAALAATLVALTVPAAGLAPWLGYLGAGAALIWVDLRTTYLPRRLSHICAAQVAAGVGLLALVDGARAWGAVIGGMVAFGLFHLLWRFSTSLGYGDVRLAAVVGALGGTLGVQGWILSLALGTLVGAAWGVIHALARRRTGAPQHFAYGPSLWLGPVLAVAVSAG